MPVPLSPLLSSMPSPSTSLSGGMSLVGAGGGLFGHILSLDKNIMPPQSDIPVNITLNGNNGFSLDPAMLALPQELSSLSEEDLQALLLSLSDGSQGELSNQILQSLTPGIPSKELLNKPNARNEWGCILTLCPEYSNMPTPIDDENILLAASGLTPSTMEEFKALIKATTDVKPLNQNPITEAKEDSFEADGAELTTLMTMMVFISPIPVTPEPIVSDFEFDLSTFSSLTRNITATTSETNLYDGEINPLLTIDKSQASDAGFQGSLASLGKVDDDGDKSAKLSVGDGLSGQLSTSGLGNHHLLGAALSHFNEASLLVDGNLIGSYHLSPNTNPLFMSASATGTHPATQVVAMMIEKAATGSDKAKQELSVQLDPPELGRMQIHLSMEKGEAMKVHLIAEKQETLTLLQRDSHILKSALDNAGIQMDGSSLSFDLSDNSQSFNQLLGGQQQEGQTSRNHHFAVSIDGSIISENDMMMVESQMNFIPDKATGNIHYSLLV